MIKNTCKDVVVISGYFVAHIGEHRGYQEYIDLAKRFGKPVIAIISNANQQIKKYGAVVREPYLIRQELLSYVDDALINVGDDGTVKETLTYLRTKYHHVTFVKDGLEYSVETLPEKDVKGINFYFGINKKLDSSTELCNLEKKPTFWGWEIRLSPDHKILHADKPLSVQKHFNKSERWVCNNGTAYLTINDEFIILRAGYAISIPAGTLHCLLSGTVDEFIDGVDETTRIFDWERSPRK